MLEITVRERVVNLREQTWKHQLCFTNAPKICATFELSGKKEEPIK